MRLGIWDLDNVFVNSPSDRICCLITAEKGIFSPTRSKAVKCLVISAALWLWYFTDQSLYVHMSNSNENITQSSVINFNISYGKVMTSHCSQ